MVFAINNMGSNLHLRKLRGYKTHCYIFYVLCTQKKTKQEQHQKIYQMEVWVVSIGVLFPTKLLWEKL